MEQVCDSQNAEGWTARPAHRSVTACLSLWFDAQACTICGGQGGGSMLPCLSCQRCTHDQCDSAYLHKIRGGKVGEWV
eukprot:scaffold320290_cov18-Tisochrysis_lutea.AAC.1